MEISTKITVTRVRGKASIAGKKYFQQKVALPNHKVVRFIKKIL